MRSDSSRQSEGALSWAGSFAGPLNEDDLVETGERRGRMSSAMLPGGVKFEKGKWVSAPLRAGSRAPCFLDAFPLLPAFLHNQRIIVEPQFPDILTPDTRSTMTAARGVGTCLFIVTILRCSRGEHT